VRRGHRTTALALALSFIAAVSGCGGDGDERPELRVSAAASLERAFTAFGDEYRAARTSFSFAGSDELAAQIRQGGRPDVLASANTRLPVTLHREGLVERPVVFAANRLVLAVPAGGSPVSSLAAAGRPGVKIAVGAPGVPIGDYTREVLERLGPARARAVLSNVRSEEPDVASIAARLAQGAADAGFVYATDVIASRGRLRGISLPPAAQPLVAYAAAVVSGAKHRRAALAFLTGLRGPAGRRALRAAGFEPAPGR
jgi:molybdate transport system substrate-binding protein